MLIISSVFDGTLPCLVQETSERLNTDNTHEEAVNEETAQTYFLG